MIKKAELTQGRLLFVTKGFRALWSKGNFLTLLRAESLEVSVRRKVRMPNRIYDGTVAILKDKPCPVSVSVERQCVPGTPMLKYFQNVHPLAVSAIFPHFLNIASREGLRANEQRHHDDPRGR